MITESRTASGLSVVVDRVPGAPVVAVYLWIGVGAADEGPEEQGAAHFVEHMLFKGTERFNVGDVASVVEGLGGDMNAYTSHDQTVYHATVLAEHWTQALEVLADMAQNSRFRDEEIERERGVILEEIRGDAEDPDRTLSDAISAKMYRDHPYGRPVIGSAKSVSSMAAKRIRAFWKRWYVPGNMTLSISGDLPAEEVLAQAKRCFPAKSRRVRRPKRPMEPVQKRPRAIALERGFREPVVDLAFVGVDIAHPDAAALDVLGVALGSGNAGLLGADLVLDKGLVTSAWASACCQWDNGFFSVGCTPLAGKTEAATRRLWELLVEVQQRGVSPGAVARARTQILSGRLFGRESVDERAHEAGWYALFAGNASGAEAYDRAVAAVTPKQVREVAARILLPEKCTAGLLAPKGEWSAQGFRGARPARNKVSTPVPTAGIVRATLSCGVRILVERDPRTPVASVRMLGLGGQLVERPASAGWTAAWDGCVMRGAGPWDARAFAEQVTARGGGVNSWAGRSLVGLGADFPVEQLDGGLELVRAVLEAPRLEARDLDQVKDALMEEERSVLDSPEEVAWEEVRRRLLAPHPFSLSPRGTPESLARLDPGRLLRLHRSLLSPENLVVGVVGDVDPERIISVVGSMFEDLPVGRRLEAPRRPARWPKRRRTYRLAAGREQAQVVFAWRGTRFTDGEYGALRMAEELLAGQGGRLFMELRERRSLAYSLSAEHVAAWDPGLFAVSLATDPARLDEAARGLLGEVERLAEEGPAPGELARAKQRIHGERARRSQRAHRRAYRLAFLERIGLDPAGGHARAIVEDVDGAAIQAALKARLSEGCIEVQVRPDPAL